jgi:hypothetical protein
MAKAKHARGDIIETLELHEALHCRHDAENPMGMLAMAPDTQLHVECKGI